MTTQELRALLEEVEDTREIVLGERARAAGPRQVDELQAVWSAARAEANLAYNAWRTARGRDRYATYRAAEDRADAAEDALAAAYVSSGLRNTVQGSAPGLNSSGLAAD